MYMECCNACATSTSVYGKHNSLPLWMILLFISVFQRAPYHKGVATITFVFDSVNFKGRILNYFD